MKNQIKFKVSSKDYQRALEYFRNSPTYFKYICGALRKALKTNAESFDDEILDWFRPTVEERNGVYSSRSLTLEFPGITPWTYSWTPLLGQESENIRETILTFCIIISKDHEDRKSVV